MSLSVKQVVRLSLIRDNLRDDNKWITLDD